MADSQTQAEETAIPEEGEAEAPAKKGLGVIPMAIGAIVAAGAAAGAAFVFAPAPEGEAPAAHADGGDNTGEHNETDSHAARKKPKKKKKKGGHGGKDGEGAVKPIGTIQHSEYATFLVLDPIIISIQPIGKSKHLKLTLILETADEDAELILEQGYYIKDVLNTYLRSVEGDVLEDPAAMTRLRAQILRRIRAVTPGAHIENVLITDFILT